MRNIFQHTLFFNFGEGAGNNYILASPLHAHVVISSGNYCLGLTVLRPPRPNSTYTLMLLPVGMRMRDRKKTGTSLNANVGGLTKLL